MSGISWRCWAGNRSIPWETGRWADGHYGRLTSIGIRIIDSLSLFISDLIHIVGVHGGKSLGSAKEALQYNTYYIMSCYLPRFLHCTSYITTTCSRVPGAGIAAFGGCLIPMYPYMDEPGTEAESQRGAGRFPIVFWTGEGFFSHWFSVQTVEWTGPCSTGWIRNADNGEQDSGCSTYGPSPSRKKNGSTSLWSGNEWECVHHGW